MEDTLQTYHAALLAFTRQAHEAQPLPARESLTPAEEEQCRIIGGGLIGWLEQWGPMLLEERKVTHSVQRGLEEDPLIVFLSTMPGLVAAADIAGTEQERLFFMTPEAWDEFCEEHPDPSFRWHIEIESIVDPADPTELPEELRQAQAEGPGELWVHEEGTMLAEQVGRGGSHLWRWTGEKAELVAEAYSTWVS